jgi:tetratricopeptide (TPR) repeat protein
VLVTPDRGDVEDREAMRVPLAAGIAAAALAAVAIVLIGRPTLAEHYRGAARDQVATRPAQALDSANRSLSLDPEAVQGYYVKASALARLGLYGPSRRALAEAIERERHNWVSWALLGDLAVRRGDLAAAGRGYGRASDLNPRDRELRVLATDRRLLAALHRRPGDASALIEAALVR